MALQLGRPPPDAVDGRDGVTVAQALLLEIFQRGEAVVVSGESSLHRSIRWVHSSEIRDIATFLAGGELLLTAGCGLGRTPEAQQSYVRSVAEAGIAALALELSGRAFWEVPAAVREEAERLGLPLIALGREIPFAEVATQVHHRIVDGRVAALTREQAIDATFTDLLLRGEDHLTVVEEVTRQVGRPVVLEDRAHQLRAYVGRTQQADAVVGAWEQHSRLSHGSPELVQCTASPITLRSEVWGWLHVLREDGRPSASDGYTVRRAAAAIAITLLGEQVRGARRSQRDTALISRLMLGDVDGKGFVDRALKMGRDLRGRDLVAVVTAGLAQGQPFGEEEMSALLSATGAASIIADTGEQTLLAIVALSPEQGDRAMVAALRTAPARVGVSRVVRPEQLVSAMQDARKAHAATHPEPGQRLVRFADLGVLRLLMALAEQSELASYVEDELGRLLAHDASTANPLLPTLQAYLECDGRKTEAAQKLYVQRRTLYYRLDRIGALLDQSLDVPETRHRLLLAVRGLELLRHQAHEHRAGTAWLSTGTDVRSS